MKNARFEMLDNFADRLIYDYDKNNDDDQDFLFTIDMKPSTEEAVKDYLIKQKQFVLDYIILTGYFMNSHLYQLYLEYIPYKLTDIEKSFRIKES